MTQISRPIKFRAWDTQKNHFCFRQEGVTLSNIYFGTRMAADLFDSEDRLIWMQFTGLHDKNGLAEIYEGDIIDANGTLKGNIYESPQIYQEGIDCLIEGMGTKTWRDTESIAVGRGCKYTKQ